MAEKAVVLDLETVPNELFPLWDEKEEDKFPPPQFHKIVTACYSVLDSEGSLEEIVVLNEDEKSIIENLASVIGNPNFRVVTWAGRRFDIPVIMYRAMKHGIQTPWHSNHDFNNRYRNEGHFDLQDHLMHFGASNIIKLDQFAPLIGLPGKIEVKGSDVRELVARGNLNRVGSYCVTDVVQTTVIFIRYAYTLGILSLDEYNDAIDSIPDYYQKVNTRTVVPDYITSKDSMVIEGLNRIFTNCKWECLRL